MFMGRMIYGNRAKRIWGIYKHLSFLINGKIWK
jgi:hypothetical protein